MSTKNKKRLFLTLVVVVIIIVAFVYGLSLVGFDNIKAVYYGVRYDNDEIHAMKQTSSERLDKKVQEYGYIIAREPTADEIKAVESGEITEEQLSEIISSGITLDEYRKNGYKKKSDTVSEETKTEGVAAQSSVHKNDAPSQNVKNDNTSKSSATGKNPKPTQSTVSDKSQAECDEKVSQIVAKMYILRSTFTSALSGLVSRAAADLAAGDTKSAVASRYIGQGRALEAQCDESVDALMSELTGILKKYGRSTELVNTIYATYESEKQYTKAHYMSSYIK